MSISFISPAELAELFESGRKIDLVDVCTPAEYREVHIAFARNAPLGQLDSAGLMQSRDNAADEPLYVICRSGNRGKQACEKFLKAGYANIVNVEGGLTACLEAGLPIVRGKKAISLERQVRMVIGTFVLLGVSLGWLLHPAFLGLSAFMGAGLIFAGITGTCALGLLIARMPWNRCDRTAEPGCAYMSSEANAS